MDLFTETECGSVFHTLCKAYREKRVAESRQAEAEREENLKIACAYEEARSFTAGYAAVKKNGIWGYVDEKGSMAVSPVFDGAGLMTREGVAPVCHGDAWTLIQLKIMD